MKKYSHKLIYILPLATLIFTALILGKREPNISLEECLIDYNPDQTGFLAEVSLKSYDTTNSTLYVLCHGKKVPPLKLGNTVNFAGYAENGGNRPLEKVSQDTFFSKIKAGDSLQLNVSPKENEYFVNSAVRNLQNE